MNDEKEINKMNNEKYEENETMATEAMTSSNEETEDISDTGAISNMFILWSVYFMNGNKDQIDEMNKKFEGDGNDSLLAFFNIIVQTKLNIVGVKIKFNNISKIIFYLCSGGHPGFLQIIVKEFLMKLKELYNLEEEREISPLDFAYAYFKEFPIVSNNMEEWEKKWHEQKISRGEYVHIFGKDEIPPDNKVDTVEYWRELINSIE